MPPVGDLENEWLFTRKPMGNCLKRLPLKAQFYSLDVEKWIEPNGTSV